MSDNENFDPWSNQGDKTPKKKKPGEKLPVPPESNLEEIFKKFNHKKEQYFGRGGPANPSSPRGIATIALVLLAIYLIFSTVFIVGSGQQAVILRFGEYHRTSGTGLTSNFPLQLRKFLFVM